MQPHTSTGRWDTSANTVSMPRTSWDSSPTASPRVGSPVGGAPPIGTGPAARHGPGMIRRAVQGGKRVSGGGGGGIPSDRGADAALARSQLSLRWRPR